MTVHSNKRMHLVVAALRRPQAKRQRHKVSEVTASSPWKRIGAPTRSARPGLCRGEYKLRQLAARLTGGHRVVSRSHCLVQGSWSRRILPHLQSLVVGERTGLARPRYSPTARGRIALVDAGAFGYDWSREQEPFLDSQTRGDDLLRARCV